MSRLSDPIVCSAGDRSSPSIALVRQVALGVGRVRKLVKATKMQDPSNEEVLATVNASLPRRVVALGLLCVLAVLVIYVAIATPPALGWQIFLIAVGTSSLMVANAVRKATASELELTREELRDTSGIILVRLEDVASIDRGAFAFKPSNGFLLRLKKPHSRGWRPGLWWRSSRRIGVGGMTPGGQTKFMSDIIAVMLKEREDD